jgi:hypothetical protein
MANLVTLLGTEGKSFYNLDFWWANLKDSLMTSPAPSKRSSTFGDYMNW